MSEVLDKVKHIEPVILANRENTESNRRLAPEIVASLKELRLCRIGLQRDLGGMDEGPATALSTFQHLAGMEASVAWVVWNNHYASTFARYLSDKDRFEVFGNHNHIYANSARPEGVAKKEGDTYNVTGRWTLVSGCEISDWFALRCIVQPGEEVPQLGPGTKLRIVFVPKEAVKVIDTWKVGALRGSGSHDVEVDNYPVAHSKTMAFEEKPILDTPYSRLPISAVNSAGCAAMAIGLAMKATETLIELGKSKVTPGKNPDLRDRPPVQAVVAKVTAQLGASKNHLHQALEPLWKAAQDSDPIDDNMLAELWGAAHVAAVTSRAALSEVFAVAGTVSMYQSCPIERSFRDIHGVLQHGIIQPHWMNQVGMVKMGLDTVSPMFRT